MKGPYRLRESSDSEVERLLLGVGRERAPRGAKGRALAAVGVIGASATVGKTAGAVTAGKAIVGAKAASLVSVKWIVVLALASLGAVAATVAVQAARTERVVASPAETALAAPGPYGAQMQPLVRPPSVPVAATVSVSASASAAPAAPAAAAATPPTPSGGAPRGSGGATSSAAEIAMLDEARGAIDSSEPARALSILEGYRSRFPRGVMGPEASILRIEALVNAGDRAAATRAADAFLHANPSSPYAPRITSLLGATSP